MDDLLYVICWIALITLLILGIRIYIKEKYNPELDIIYDKKGSKKLILWYTHRNYIGEWCRNYKVLMKL